MKLLLIMLLSFTANAFAEKFDPTNYSESLDFAQITNVVATQSSNGSWCFNTSVEHNDEGWGHYADGWEVIDLDGNQLAYRELLHPHDHEQPFTRSQCNIEIPKNVTKVAVRAKCKEHGYGGKSIIVDLKESIGAGYSVKSNK